MHKVEGERKWGVIANKYEFFLVGDRNILKLTMAPWLHNSCE